MSKFDSLQGLRAISICLVFIFHLFPKFFVQGFVGVDMFFVLSGFLMSKILSSSKTVDFKTFYIKRIKRILPLYFLTILSTVIAVLFFVFKNDRQDFTKDVKWALSLVLNYEVIFEHRSYWDQVATIRYLTHLWSLCTELQYYLIVPIIHFISSKHMFQFRIASYIIAITASFMFQVLTPFELSFSFLASRTWQFLLGHLAYEIPKRKKIDEEIVSFTFPLIFVSILTIVSLLPPGMFSETLIRIIMSILAALQCYFCQNLEKSIFTSKPLVYIGDLSYVIYLIHWPVINIVRYIQLKDDSNLSISEALVAILITLFLSCIVHHKLEKKMIEADFIISVIVIVLCASLSYSTISELENRESLFANLQSRELQSQLSWNIDNSKILTPINDLPCIDRSDPSDLNIAEEPCILLSNGTGKILVIGNSLAIRAFPAIYEFLNGNFSELRLYARTGSAPFIDAIPEYTNATIRVTQAMKPDLLWIVQGVHEIVFPFHLYADRLDDETLDRTAQRVLDQLKENARMVVLDLPYYLLDEKTNSVLARKLLYGHEFEKSSTVDEDLLFTQLYKPTQRLLNLNCSNCYFNHIQESIMQNRSDFLKYDEETKAALIYDGAHLSKITYNKYLRDVYLKQIQRFYSLFQV